MSADFWFQQQGGGPNPGLIGQSLRFRGSGTAFPPNVSLGQNNATSGGSTTLWTCSLWVKRGDLGAIKMLFSSIYQPNNNEAFSVQFTANDTIKWGRYSDEIFETAQRFRDPSAWYHLVFVWDSANATAAHRCRLYVNGEEVTTWANRSDPALNAGNPWCQNGPVPGGSQNLFGRQRGIGLLCWYQTLPYNGYMAEFHCVQGQALDPGTFGEFNDDGVWIPREVNLTTAQYGSNGFYLDFSDPNNIGADRSGNGNNWTPTGFELTDTASTLYDWMADSPTDNFSTFNPLIPSPGSNTASNGNLTNTNSSLTYGHLVGTQALPDAGRFYFEDTVVTRRTAAGDWVAFGLVDEAEAMTSVVTGGRGPGRITYGDRQDTSSGCWNEDTLLFTGASCVIDQDDVVKCAVDTGTGELWFGRNADWFDPTGAITGGPDAGAQATMVIDTSKTWFPRSLLRNSGTQVISRTFLQRPATQTVPAGFEPLSTAELPNVAITNPSEHCRTILDTGANILGSAQAAFPNGLWWIKDRDNANQHQLVDSVRGGNLAWTSPTRATETAYSAPSGNSVAWCWNLLPDRSNGFDIVTYNGNGSPNHAIGHNLGAEPEFIITARRNGSDTTAVYHKEMRPGANSSDLYMSINNVNPRATQTTVYSGTLPDVTNFYVGNSNIINGATGTYVSYLWRSVPGFSAFGSYRGNNNADGTFVYTGHRPRFVLLKCASANGNWMMMDSERSPFNPVADTLWAEKTGTGYNGPVIDFLSNGFKLRIAGSNYNENADFIWASWAEHPFGGANVAPSPAR